MTRVHSLFIKLSLISCHSLGILLLLSAHPQNRWGKMINEIIRWMVFMSCLFVKFNGCANLDCKAKLYFKKEHCCF